ncbi:MAG: hypothetical protein U0414_30985 [Polyangiaceae bacterium]
MVRIPRDLSGVDDLGQSQDDGFGHRRAPDGSQRLQRVPLVAGVRRGAAGEGDQERHGPDLFRFGDTRDERGAKSTEQVESRTNALEFEGEAHAREASTARRLLVI